MGSQPQGLPLQAFYPAVGAPSGTNMIAASAVYGNPLTSTGYSSASTPSAYTAVWPSGPSGQAQPSTAMQLVYASGPPTAFYQQPAFQAPGAVPASASADATHPPAHLATAAIGPADGASGGPYGGALAIAVHPPGPLPGSAASVPAFQAQPLVAGQAPQQPTAEYLPPQGVPVVQDGQVRHMAVAPGLGRMASPAVPGPVQPVGGAVQGQDYFSMDDKELKRLRRKHSNR
mmetsp:Transcript_20477/g.48760  ORF Transcript_20477/g.48760 Transcript_20477/m.48760 type:complete len:231 (-) Transcript_20477:766-1458(-)